MSHLKSYAVEKKSADDLAHPRWFRWGLLPGSHPRSTQPGAGYFEGEDEGISDSPSVFL